MNQTIPPISQTANQVVLSVRNISIEYKTNRGMLQAVHLASFDLHRGEILALIGESGSGKTTLGLGLIRMLPKTACISQGQVIYYRLNSTEQGQEPLVITGLPSAGMREFRWQECAMVFQSALNSLNPVLRVSEHFNDTAQAHGIKLDNTFRDHAFELLKWVRLDASRVWNSYPHELSGGMRQRVILALALVLDPAIVILDEPTTALDILTQRTIINLLKELRERLHFSMIFISHDLSLAAEMADRVVTMYGGRVVEEADVYTTFTRPTHPYTIGLINAVPTLSGREEDLISIPGSPPDLVHLPTGCKFHPRCPLAVDHCRTEEPPTENIDPGHQVACWRWSETGNRKNLFRE